MAEPFRKALLKMTGRVRLYCPHGAVAARHGVPDPPPAENTANESFLRQTFVEGVERDASAPIPSWPVDTRPQAPAAAQQSGGDGAFRQRSVPGLDAARRPGRPTPRHSTMFEKTSAGRIRSPSAAERSTPRIASASVNPANPSEIIGYACQAGPAEVDQAVAAARNAFPAWRDTPPARRAAFLVSAAAAARRRIFELAAWQTLEAGKQWTEAYLDVGEAIDFLDYYAREMVRLAEPRRLGNVPGEATSISTSPRGSPPSSRPGISRWRSAAA